MKWDRISYELEKHWLGYHSATAIKLDDDNIVVCFQHHNSHFLSEGSFYIILSDDETNCVSDILKNLNEDFDLPIFFGGSEECFWEDYVNCKLTLYRDDLVNETGNQYVVEKLDELFSGLIMRREELISQIEDRYIRCIRFENTYIEYDVICQKYILIRYKDDDYKHKIKIISKEEIGIILNSLFDDLKLPHENDSKLLCEINESFGIYCNSASYEKIFLVLNEISEKKQCAICGIAELKRKIIGRSKSPLVVLVNKHMKQLQFLNTDGYVYKINFTDQWDQEKCLDRISDVLEMGTYSLTKKWNQKWVDFLKYHMESVVKWDTYSQSYDYKQTYRVFYNFNGNLMQVGIYEVANGKKIRLQQIPNDKHCLGVILGMQENHSLFWN